MINGTRTGTETLPLTASLILPSTCRQHTQSDIRTCQLNHNSNGQSPADDQPLNRPLPSTLVHQPQDEEPVCLPGTLRKLALVLGPQKLDSKPGDTHQVRAFRTKDIMESRPGGVEKPRI